MPRITPDIGSKARALRNAATPEERLLWIRLRHLRPRFTRQLPVGRYILDFACRQSKLGDNPDGVAETILSALDVRLGRTHPRPLPFREGR